MKWYLKELNEWISNGCDNVIALQITELDLTFNNLKTIHVGLVKTDCVNILPIEIGNLINLKYLNLSLNDLTTVPIEIFNLINLQELYLHDNKLTTIPAEIGNLINLKYLSFSCNEITTIPVEIGNLINLEKISFSYNNLTTIPNEIGNLINLKELYLYNNKLTIIPAEIGNLINLRYLYLNVNKLTMIPAEIGNLINLIYLDFSNNDLTTLPIEITNIIHYQIHCQIHYYNNPIEYIPPQVTRYLNRNKTTQKIYNDSQSVHNHSIQEGIRKSINYIMSIKQIYNLDNLNDIIINNTFINNKTKTILFEYINCKDVHSILNVTFAELLINVISFIDQHEAKIEIYKVLEQEMNDTICKCFTGRMSRLINCLNGFDDHIVINISDTEQIGNIIILIKDKLIAENNYTIELHKEIVMKELYDRGYDKDVIDEWIDYI
jgi:Leucine-rich repeat (LRR) protein